MIIGTRIVSRGSVGVRKLGRQAAAYQRLQRLVYRRQGDVVDLRAYRREHLVGGGVIGIAVQEPVDRGSLLREPLSVRLEGLSKDPLGILFLCGKLRHSRSLARSWHAGRRIRP